MDIISEITQTGLKISSKLESLKMHKDTLSNSIVKGEKEIAEIYTAHEKRSRILDDVYDFIDYLGISKECLPYKYESLDEEKIEQLNHIIAIFKQERDMLEEELQYLEEYNTKLEGIIDLKERRNKEDGIISDIELCIDIKILQKRALLIQRKMYSWFSYDNARESYSKIFRLFTLESMRTIGHPEQDEALYNGKAELINAICRVVWGQMYLDKLSEMMNRLKRLGFQKLGEIRKLKKNAKQDQIIVQIADAISVIQKTQYKKEFYYTIYRKTMTEEAEERILRFIGAIRYGIGNEW